MRYQGRTRSWSIGGWPTISRRKERRSPWAIPSPCGISCPRPCMGGWRRRPARSRSAASPRCAAPRSRGTSCPRSRGSPTRPRSPTGIPPSPSIAAASARSHRTTRMTATGRHTARPRRRSSRLRSRGGWRAVGSALRPHGTCPRRPCNLRRTSCGLPLRRRRGPTAWECGSCRCVRRRKRRRGDRRPLAASSSRSPASSWLRGSCSSGCSSRFWSPRGGATSASWRPSAGPRRGWPCCSRAWQAWRRSAAC